MDISGASDVKLHMKGGILSGDISGASTIEYTGEVTAQTVDTSGASAVTKKIKMPGERPAGEKPLWP